MAFGGDDNDRSIKLKIAHFAECVTEFFFRIQARALQYMDRGCRHATMPQYTKAKAVFGSNLYAHSGEYAFLGILRVLCKPDLRSPSGLMDRGAFHRAK